MKVVFQNADHFWAYIETEKAFFRNAIQGMTVSIVMAFIILLFATGNILITLYSILTISCVVVCVVAVFVFKGFEIGATISIAMVIVIGFSVDYVCHLAAHYVHSIERNRYEKATGSVRDMGVSIFSGAVTTFGSGVFLFGGKAAFFD